MSCQFKKGSEVRIRDVVIIGAGIAGLSAAKTLHDNGVQSIEILEAQNYIGGRIKTEKHGDGFVEMGAQWLRCDDNDFRKFCSQNDLLSFHVSRDSVGKYVRRDGYIFDQDEVDEVKMAVDYVLDGFKKNGSSSRTYPENVSVGEYLRAEMNDFCNEIKDETCLKRFHLTDWHVGRQHVEHSCRNLDDVVAVRRGDYHPVYGEPTPVAFKNGFSSILDAIIRGMHGVTISLTSPVTKIIWKDSKQVCVHCNGIVYVTKHVICTIPLGALKENERMFTPPLPPSIVTAIRSLGFGTIGKVILEFEQPWWKDAKGIQIVRYNDDEADLWTDYITGFVVLETGMKNTLLGWVGGDGVLLMEYLDIMEIARDCLRLLIHSAADLQLQFSHLKSLKWTKWFSNPYFRGTGTYVSVKCNETKVTPSSLHEPVLRDGVPVILFAGEACHDTHYSTVHGAYESGQQQATYLVNYMKQN